MAQCKACGRTFEKEYNRQMYCCDDCRQVAKRQQWRNASMRYYHKHKHDWGSRSVRRYGIGTGALGAHANTEDFNQEHATIRKEKARLQIK